MNSVTFKRFAGKSPSLESLNVHTHIQTSILTSTKNLEGTSLDNNRRKAIVPTPHRPNLIRSYDIVNNTNKANDLLSNQHPLIQTHPQHSQDHSDPTNQIEKKIGEYSKTLDTIHQSHDNHTETQSQMDENEQEDNFDAFILQHFIPFSGNQNVNNWLDETENKFSQLKISRNLRFDAISLLVEGDAKRLYIKHRKSILSFDDFYEFLVSHFTTEPGYSSQSSSHHTTITHPTTKLGDQPKLTTPNNYDMINSQQQSSLLNTTTGFDLGATNTIGVQPHTKSTTIISDFSSNMLDQTTNDLRKAIVSDLIKNPKVFRGAKDDVQKWIEDIEHLLEIACIPESSRLKLISYSLRGDALQWYKINKDMFTSWPVFIHELQRAFTSSFYAELAFRKLESYTQGEHQSIRNFFNEILKLCKEADSTMSEATKLKNLLNKTKPSIQLEVRKKKPTSPAEFLEYAKDVEELLELSNSNLDNSKNNNSTNLNQQPSSVRTTTNTSNNYYANDLVAPKFTSGYSKNTNNNDNNYNNQYQNRPNRDSYQPLMQATTPFRLPQSSTNQSRDTAPRFPTNRNNFSLRKNDNGRFHPRQNQPYSSNTSQPRPRMANTISPSDPSTDIELESDSLSSIFCTQCNQPGHDVSSCQNF